VSIHVAVQAYGYTAPYRWGIYGALLDLTLGLVLLHGFLGARATILETSLPSSARAVLVWLIGILSFGLLFVRLLVL
jgi:succinate dehydrogenase hydrophobic anchor subunit